MAILLPNAGSSCRGAAVLWRAASLWPCPRTIS